MVEHDKDSDEYHFVDLDTIPSDEPDENQNTQRKESTFTEKSLAGKTNVLRNSLVVVLLLLVVIVMYKIINKSTSIGKTEVASIATVPAQKITPIVAVTPVVSIDSKINEKLSALVLKQDNMEDNFAANNIQLNHLNTNIDGMMAKLNEVNQTIALSTAKIEEQALEIERLNQRVETVIHPKITASSHHHVAAPHVRYYIQAVIPGRAWLISTNGATMTVREGSIIAGLGMVKSIDAHQGRVLTTSGRVIRFSQADS